MLHHLTFSLRTYGKLLRISPGASGASGSSILNGSWRRYQELSIEIVRTGTTGRETPMLKPKETFVAWQAYLGMESLPIFFGISL